MMYAQIRLAHLQRANPFRLAKEATLGLEDNASEVAFTSMQRLVDNNVSKGQLTLPRRFGVLGLRATSELKAHATYLIAAGHTSGPGRKLAVAPCSGDH